MNENVIVSRCVICLVVNTRCDLSFSVDSFCNFVFVSIFSFWDDVSRYFGVCISLSYVLADE